MLTQQCHPDRAKRRGISNNGIRDVSTTVDMTSTRFSVYGSTAILLPILSALSFRTAGRNLLSCRFLVCTSKRCPTYVRHDTNSTSFPIHNLRCRETFLKQHLHVAHVRIGVAEEHLVTLAKHIHIWFSVLCICKTVLGALAMAEEIVAAAFALHRKGIAFVASECLLFGAAVHRRKFLVHYVTQAVFGIDKVVA